jgi:hypothetical protein
MTTTPVPPIILICRKTAEVDDLEQRLLDHDPSSDLHWVLQRKIDRLSAEIDALR